MGVIWRTVGVNPWFEAVGVSLITLLGVGLGVWSRRLRRPYWAIGYVVSVILVAVLLVGRVTSMQFAPVFSWLVATRMRFVIVALAAALGLTAPLPHLPHRWERVGVCLLMGGVLVHFSLLPFLMPALIHNRLVRLESTIDDDGVCLQTTKYTCGPAAAVTALLRLGLPASESQIAILSRSSPVVGTLPVCLSRALARRYEADGLRCHYRKFDSIAQLPRSGITLVVVKNALFRDHCVAVLDVSDRTVTVADPITGITAIPREQFRSTWRFCGIVLTRVPTEAPPLHCRRDS